MYNLFMIGVAPMSWRLGKIRNANNKKVWALGPFRVSVHRVGMD